MALKGDIKTIPVSDIFQWLGNSNKTGVLIFLKKKVQKNFFFENGHIVFASSNRPQERLGEYLVNTNTLSRPIVVEALKKSHKEGVTFIAYLLRENLIDYKELEAIVEKLTTLIFTNLLNWTKGSFMYLDNARTKEPVRVKLSLDVISLVLNGSRELDETFNSKKLEDSVEIDYPSTNVVTLEDGEFSSSKNALDSFLGWEKGEIICPRCKKTIPIAVQQSKHYDIDSLRKLRA